MAVKPPLGQRAKRQKTSGCDAAATTSPPARPHSARTRAGSTPSRSSLKKSAVALWPSLLRSLLDKTSGKSARLVRDMATRAGVTT